MLWYRGCQSEIFQPQCVWPGSVGNGIFMCNSQQSKYLWSVESCGQDDRAPESDPSEYAGWRDHQWAAIYGCGKWEDHAESVQPVLHPYMGTYVYLWMCNESIDGSDGEGLWYLSWYAVQQWLQGLYLHWYGSAGTAADDGRYGTGRL